MAHLATGIVSPTAAAHWGAAYGHSSDAVVGTGPFKIVSWKKDQELVLERNDAYWGAAPRLRRVIYRPVPEAESRIAALEAGDLDVIKSMTAAGGANPFALLTEETERILTFAYKFRALSKLIMDCVTRRRAQSDEHQDLLAMLMAARDRKTGEAMPDKQLLDEIMTLMRARQ
jgi:MarR-like DNA-binding transcriptional regulator SgrR of sgrS sRNA